AAPAGESVSAVMARLALQEAPAPVRQRARWRAPRKILLLAFDASTAAKRDELASAAPGAQFVLARDVPSAISAAADADVIVGFNPQICNRGILDAAHELRYVLSLAAGVENCMAVPSVRERDLLLTNMRAVDSAAIAEHALALALALAHGLD